MGTHPGGIVVEDAKKSFSVWAGFLAALFYGMYLLDAWFSGFVPLDLGVAECRLTCLPYSGGIYRYYLCRKSTLCSL
jgi:hypothetical protein